MATTAGTDITANRRAKIDETMHSSEIMCAENPTATKEIKFARRISTSNQSLWQA
jgi:hypothetical protein